MNKYIIEILKVQSSVILPGLGALMITSERTGKVVFNAHLKFNDGSLAKFIAEKEGVDKQDAENQVAKFVREIEAELAKGGKYEIFDFGHFHNNKDGQVDFVMKAGASDALAKADTTTKAAPKKEETKKEEPKKVDKKEAKKEAAAAKELAKKEAAAKKEAEKKAVADKKEAAIKAEALKKEAAKKEAAKKTEEKNTKNTFVPADKKEEVKAVKEENKKEEDLKTSIPVVGATKAETPQEKNSFVPKKEDIKKEADQAKTSITGAKTTITDKKEVVADKAKTSIAAAKENKASVKGKPTPKKKEKKEKKKRKMWPWLLLLLLLAGGAVGGYFYQNELKSFFFTGVNDDHDADGEKESHDDSEGNEIAENTDEIGTEELIDDSTATEEVLADEMNEVSEEVATEEVIEEVVEEQPVVNNTSSSPSGSYHIIGNAFAEQSNAEGYVSAMNAKGYSAQILGRFDGLHLVAIKSFDSREAANSGLSGVSSDAPSAWVFKYAK